MNRRRISRAVAGVAVVAAIASLAPARAGATIDPKSEHLRILGAYLAEDGRNVLFNAYDDAKQSVRGAPDIVGLVLDLTTRECRPIGDRIAIIGPSQRTETRDGARSPRYSGFRAQVIDESASPFAIDARGRRTGSGAVDASIFDGSPSAAELGLDARHRVVVPLGLGYGVIDQNDRARGIACVDPFRRKMFDPAKLFPGSPSALSKTWIRPGRWLVRRAAGAAYELFDPDTGRSDVPEGLSAADEIGLALTDGRFVITSGSSIAVYAPETGVREPIVLRADAIITVRGISPNEHFYRCDPAKTAVIQVMGVEWTGLARLDLARKEIVPALGSKGLVLLVATLDGDDLLAVEEGRRLVKLTIGSWKRDVVLPAR